MLLKEKLMIGNRIAVQPMEGWDGLADGNPSEHTLRRWQRFGRSGGKLIWGGEAVAVSHEGRANPNQLLAAEHTTAGLSQLRTALVEEHRRVTGSDHGLVLGLQLTHSGRFSRPNSSQHGEPGILYHHPILDRRMKLPDSLTVMIKLRMPRSLRPVTIRTSLGRLSCRQIFLIQKGHGSSSVPAVAIPRP